MNLVSLVTLQLIKHLKLHFFQISIPIDSESHIYLALFDLIDR